jgi:hypothetical protein
METTYLIMTNQVLNHNKPMDKFLIFTNQNHSHNSFQQFHFKQGQNYNNKHKLYFIYKKNWAKFINHRSPIDHFLNPLVWVWDVEVLSEEEEFYYDDIAKTFCATNIFLSNCRPIHTLFDTPRKQSIALSKNGFIIQYIKDPTPSQQMRAVNQNPLAILCIETPDATVEDFVLNAKPYMCSDDQDRLIQHDESNVKYLQFFKSDIDSLPLLPKDDEPAKHKKQEYDICKFAQNLYLKNKLLIAQLLPKRPLIILMMLALLLIVFFIGMDIFKIYNYNNRHNIFMDESL